MWIKTEEGKATVLVGSKGYWKCSYLILITPLTFTEHCIYSGHGKKCFRWIIPFKLHYRHMG